MKLGVEDEVIDRPYLRCRVCDEGFEGSLPLSERSGHFEVACTHCGAYHSVDAGWYPETNVTFIIS